MNKSIAVKIKRVLPSLVLLSVIVLLVGLSFLPSVRGGGATVSARSTTLDPEAMRVLNCCRAYAAVHDYSTKLDGKIKAKVMGIPYTQAVTGERTVSGDMFCEVAESVSVLVKEGIKKERTESGFSVAHGDYRKKAFVYGEARSFGREEYVAAYGMPFTDIVKYELDNSIVSAERVGDNAFRFVLDASRAAKYSRNEVRTLLGGKSYPEYESIEFTLYADGERAVKITSIEKFSVDKMGGTNCTAQYTEVFSYRDI